MDYEGKTLMLNILWQWFAFKALIKLFWKEITHKQCTFSWSKKYIKSTAMKCSNMKTYTVIKSVLDQLGVLRKIR